MNDTVTKLEAARALIAEPGGWTQKIFARDVFGNAVHERSKQAVCWCAYGALFKVADYSHEAQVFLIAAADQELAEWNDAADRTQTEVVAAFDRAIELAKATPLGSAPGDDAAKDI